MAKGKSVVGEDVLAAVRAMLAGSKTTDARTVKEWADEWKLPAKTTAGIIGKAIDAGLMTPTSVQRVDMAGRNGWRCAYWIAKKSKP